MEFNNASRLFTAVSGYRRRFSSHKNGFVDGKKKNKKKKSYRVLYIGTYYHIVILLYRVHAR